MSHWRLERYHHEQAPGGWDVVTSEGIYAGGPFLSEQLAADEAARLNRAALVEREAACAALQQHNVPVRRAQGLHGNAEGT